jgi:hypothetical protein
MQLIAQVVVLSSDPKGTEFVEWQPVGDPMGGDVQIVPEVIARSAQFAKLVGKGIIDLIGADEDYKAAMDKQREAFEKRLSGAAAQANATLLQTNDNDMLSISCMGPDSRGTDGKCGTAVPVRAKTQHDKPVLCSNHEDLIGQFILTEKQEPGQPEVTKVWSRMQMTLPEKQA